MSGITQVFDEEAERAGVKVPTNIRADRVPRVTPQQDIVINIPWDPDIPLQSWLKLTAAVASLVAKELEKLDKASG